MEKNVEVKLSDYVTLNVKIPEKISIEELQGLMTMVREAVKLKDKTVVFNQKQEKPTNTVKTKKKLKPYKFTTSKECKQFLADYEEYKKTKNIDLAKKWSCGHNPELLQKKAYYVRQRLRNMGGA